MKKQSARIVDVKVLHGYMLHIAYTDGRLVSLDMAGVISEYGDFAQLAADAEEFATVKVADWGWSIEWRCGASLDCDRIIELSLEQSGLMNNVLFRHWQDDNGLSLVEAAEAIGLTRRTVSQYRTGSRPVPKTVYLACKGWEAMRKAA